MPIVNYDWDEIEDNIDEEYDDAGNTIVEYTTEPTLYGSVISQNRGGVTSHYHFDGLGNTTELTNDAGTVTDTRRYSAFGQVSLSSGSTLFVYQYVGKCGYQRDPEIALGYVRRRSLSSKLAMWLSTDPLTFIVIASQGWLTPFVYAKNNPPNNSDPSGEIECPFVIPPFSTGLPWWPCDPCDCEIHSFDFDNPGNEPQLHWTCHPQNGNVGVVATRTCKSKCLQPSAPFNFIINDCTRIACKRVQKMKCQRLFQLGDPNVSYGWWPISEWDSCTGILEIIAPLDDRVEPPPAGIPIEPPKGPPEKPPPWWGGET